MKLSRIIIFFLSSFLIAKSCLGQTLAPRPGPKSTFDDTAILKNSSVALEEALNSTIAMLRNVEILYRQTSENLLTENESKIRLKVGQYKNQLTLLQNSKTNISAIASSCLEQGGYLDLLSERIIQELNDCATVILMEVVNIISNSINEAQAFMSLPTIMAQDIQTCGLGPECLPKIVNDAFYESLETPSKVLVLAARVQQFSFKAVESVTGCALGAVEGVADLGADIVREVVECVDTVVNAVNV